MRYYAENNSKFELVKKFLQDLGESGNSLPNNSEPKETLLVDNEADMSPVSGVKTLSPVKSAKKGKSRHVVISRANKQLHLFRT